MNEVLAELHNREWLSKLCRRWKLVPWKAAVVMALINLAIDIPLGFRYDVFLPTGGVPRGLLGEPADWLYEFLIHPIILAYFVWLQGAGGELFSELAEKDVVSQNRLKQAVTKLRDRMHFRRVWIIGIVGGLAFTTWFTLAFAPNLAGNPLSGPPYDSWITADTTIALVRAPVIFVVFYAFLVALYDLLFILVALFAAFKDEEARVEALNPDRAGGLGFIGRFSANLSFLIAAMGVLLFSRILIYSRDYEGFSSLLNLGDSRNYVFLAGIVLYLILAPIIFFLPLWTAHLAMVRYRDGLLIGLSERFDDLMAEVRSSPWKSESRTDELIRQTQQLDEVRQSIGKKVPVWPFNSSSISKFFGISLSPLLAAIISALIDLIFG